LAGLEGGVVVADVVEEVGKRLLADGRCASSEAKKYVNGREALETEVVK
jgi:hypothetical protein